MKVVVRETPSEVDETVSARVVDDVTAGLQAVMTVGTQFIINDTIWFGKSRRGEITPQVVNSASFISKTIQRFLHKTKKWEKEKTLNGQTIDAYVEIDCPLGFQLDRSELGKFLDKYTTEHPEASIDEIFFRYGKRGCYSLVKLDSKFHRYFKQTAGATKMRIGLEFETGNIASSFRSLNKLNFLFRKGLIDGGVFITSRDKQSTAARIWPVSNRNGSFEELERRNYHESVTYPSWEFSFAPDDILSTAPYLGANGKTYEPEWTSEIEVVKGITYEIWTGDGKQLYRVSSQPST